MAPPPAPKKVSTVVFAEFDGVSFLCPANIQDNRAYLAGLFGQPNTEALQVNIFENNLLKPLLDKLVAHAAVRFQIPGASRMPTLGFKEMAKLFATDAIANTINMPWPVDYKAFDYTTFNDATAVHNCVILMAKFIQTCPTIFSGGGTQIGGIYMDDWFRAFAVLKMTLRNNSSSRTTQGKRKNEDAERPRLVGSARGHPGRSTTPVTHVTDDDHPLPAETALDDELSDIEITGIDLEREGETLAQTMLRIETHLQALGKPVTGKTRPYLRQPERDQLCKFILDNYVHVVSTGKDITEHNKLGGDMSEKFATDAQAFMTQSMAEEGVLAGEDNMTSDEVREFMEFQSKLEAPTPQNVPKFATACEMLGVDPKTRILTIPQAEGAPDKTLELRSWQIVAVAWISIMDKEEMDALLADDCGLGKTVIALTLIHLQKKRIAEGQLTGPYKPSIVFCPGAVVSSWFNEAKDRFGTAIRIRIWHGTKTDGLNLDQRSHTLGTKEKDLMDDINRLDPEDPNTATTLYITSYTTAHARTLCINGKPASDYAAENRKRHKKETAKKRKGKGKQDPLSALMQLADEHDVDGDPQDDDGEGPTGVNYVDSTIFAGRFNWGICDEAHKIKNPKTYNARVVMAFKVRRLLGESATPMANAIIDLYGFLVAFWKPEWASPREMEEAEEDPLSFYGISSRSTESEDGRSTESHDGPDEAPSVTHVMGDAPLKRAHLNPASYLACMRQGGAEPHIAQGLLRKVLSQICLRRSFASFIELEDGTMEQVGAEIPPFTMRTVELDYGRKAQREEFRQHYAGFVERIRRTGSTNDAKAVDPEHGNEDMENMRKMQLLTVSLVLARLCKLMDNKKGKTGLKNVNEWFSTGEDNGMSYLWRACACGDASHLPAPKSRSDFVKWICALAPKLGWLANHVNELVKKGERVLIFADYPLTQWLVEGLLCLMNFNVSSIRSAHTQAQRDATIDDFNDAKSVTNVMVVGIRVAAYGINAHKQCHNAVHVEVPGAMSMIHQGNGRLYRLGQQFAQSMYLLTLDGSYDLIAQGKLVAKYLPQLIGSVTMPVWPAKIVAETDQEKQFDMKDAFLLDYADQLVQRMLGQSSSRLAFADAAIENPPRLRVRTDVPATGTPVSQRFVTRRYGSGKKDKHDKKDTKASASGHAGRRHLGVSKAFLSALSEEFIGSDSSDDDDSVVSETAENVRRVLDFEAEIARVPSAQPSAAGVPTEREDAAEPANDDAEAQEMAAEKAAAEKIRVDAEKKAAAQEKAAARKKAAAAKAAAREKAAAAKAAAKAAKEKAAAEKAATKETGTKTGAKDTAGAKETTGAKEKPAGKPRTRADAQETPTLGLGPRTRRPRKNADSTPDEESDEESNPTHHGLKRGASPTSADPTQSKQARLNERTSE